MTDTATFNARINAMCAFVQARCDEDELWAVEASRDCDRAVPSGAHWKWFTENDQAVEPDPLTMEYVDDDERYASLRSVERFPGRYGELPLFAIHSAEEVKVPVGGHIIRHDPARVLAEVEAKRSRVAALLTYARKADEIHANPDRFGDGNRGEILGMLMAYSHAVCVDAEIWAGHPGYEPAWRIGP